MIILCALPTYLEIHTFGNKDGSFNCNSFGKLVKQIRQYSMSNLRITLKVMNAGTFFKAKLKRSYIKIDLTSLFLKFDTTLESLI